jgi:hypothetical protein
MKRGQENLRLLTYRRKEFGLEALPRNSSCDSGVMDTPVYDHGHLEGCTGRSCDLSVLLNLISALSMLLALFVIYVLVIVIVVAGN